jgi:magnesium transporter
MIKTRLFLSGEMQVGGVELIATWRDHPDSVIWVDLVENQQATEAEFLEREFAIHTLAIEDAQRERHPPKIEAFSDYTFILLKGLSADSKDIDFDTIQLALFVGESFLITRHSGASKSINRLEAHLESQSDVTEYSDLSKLALLLCRMVVDRYLNILLALEPRLEELEELMLEHSDDNMLAELIGYKSDLKRLGRFATYHEQLFRTLRNKTFPGFSDSDRTHEVIDVWEQQERTCSLSLLYYETASDLIDGYISIASHRLNQIMKILTIITAVFVPLSFLAGIYGMNFENMPELHSRSGYFILLGVMVTIATIFLVAFRRMKWL